MRAHRALHGGTSCPSNQSSQPTDNSSTTAKRNPKREGKEKGTPRRVSTTAEQHGGRAGKRSREETAKHIRQQQALASCAVVVARWIVLPVASSPWRRCADGASLPLPVGRYSLRQCALVAEGTPCVVAYLFGGRHGGLLCVVVRMHTRGVWANNGPKQTAAESRPASSGPRGSGG